MRPGMFPHRFRVAGRILWREALLLGLLSFQMLRNSKRWSWLSRRPINDWLRGSDATGAVSVRNRLASRQESGSCL